MTKLFAGLATVLAAGALPASPAAAYPIFWTDSSKTTPLFDQKASDSAPDVLEFTNQEPVTLSAPSSKGESTVVCGDVNLGASVIINDGVEETTLSLPFGVFRGDQCVGSTGQSVPTRFELLPKSLGTGVIGTETHTALLTVTGATAPFTATLHHIKIWQVVAGKFCAWNLELATGSIENATEGFVEQEPPNLSLHFSEVEVPIANAARSKGCPTAGRFSADFLFLETTSTVTDTAFLG